MFGAGDFAVFSSGAVNLVPGDGNGVEDVFIRGPDPADPAADITGDGDREDSVLTVLDASGGAPSAPQPLCPATSASVAAGQVVFLRPEDAGPTPSLPHCPAAALVDGNPDLSGDGDSSDEVVHFWSQSENAVLNLGLAARAVSASGSWIAALASECDQAGAITAGCPAGGTDLNGDGDAGDLVLEVHEACQPLASCSWMQPLRAGSAQAADSVDVEGSVVAVLTPEAAQGQENLNGASSPDTDASDRVLQVFEAATGTLTNVGQAAEEFVLGHETTSCDGSGTMQLVAFRTSEAAQGGQDLNGDGDATDDVLQVYDAKSGTLLSSGQAVTPCRLEACNPRYPYRVFGRRVKFLTYEPDQGADLDGDGTATGLVLQSFDFCTAKTASLSSVTEQSDRAFDPLSGSAGGETSMGATEGETLMVEAGRCLETIATGCATNADCPSASFCDVGLCKREHGVCVTNADCAPDSSCEADLVVATDIDADVDNVPDSADNCPEVANDSQDETLATGVGDACVPAVCGNDVTESIEQCDGTDDAACPGDCLSDCTCRCGQVPTDPKAKVIVKSKKASGIVRVKMLVELGVYSGEPVLVRLDDSDSTPIAIESIPTVPARGKSGKKWLYKQRDDGIQKIMIKDRTKKSPATFLIVVKSKHWFSSAAANQAAAATDFTAVIGDRCFRHEATKKIE
ncbi:MAG: hypothetical protein D6760_09955 [Deltaproteobacteria bacterium]|nr:MAG: hypothetical protein D6760_09955 [Deltaproteobacteria bacterium]